VKKLSTGIKIGHATNHKFHTGCTVFLCPDGTIGSVDVRGLGPASRELMLMAPDKEVQTINAVLLTGGSAFGLSAADGVMHYLQENDIGHPTPVKRIPIVAAAAVYDLFFSKGDVMPDAAFGYEACQAAQVDNTVQGNVGAGSGVTVGKWYGWQWMMKSGFGLATHVMEHLIVTVAAVVNSRGDVVNSDGSVLAGARAGDISWQAENDRFRRFPDLTLSNLRTNTTLVVVTTNANLNKVDAYRVAQRAHDGMAIAIRPSHTTHEGDTAFTLATNRVEAKFDDVANIAVELVAEAIRNAVLAASSLSGVPGLG